MKQVMWSIVLGIALCGLSGCGNKKGSVSRVAPEDRDEHISTIYTAFNKKEYDATQHLIGRFLERYPEDNNVPSFKLMVADMMYEQKKYPESYEAYQHFQQYYPADQQAEYAAYKAAHAKFNQANHVNCDTTAVESTITLCTNYKARADYQKYRTQIDDLQRTCQRHLIDNELYVVNTYLNQNRLTSARHRIDRIKNSCNLEEEGSVDKCLFYEAKLAKTENNTEELDRILNELHTAYPRSQFTAMADRLNRQGGLLG